MKKNNYSNMSAIAVEKSLLKEYQTSNGRTVYLDKDSEFQIKLFNPTRNVIGAKVFINGDAIGNPIIIKPGQLIWLERYLEEARKFKFDVYEVDANSSEVQKAIANNGDVKVEFYKEVKKDLSFGIVNESWPWGDHRDYLGNPYAKRNLVTKSLFNTNDLVGSTYSIDTNLSCCNTINKLTTSSLDSCEFSRNSENNVELMSNISGTIETGRVDKGGYSNQKFELVDINLEYYPFATEYIKLLPKSQKPVFKDDLEKIYCHECGRKIKNKFKFCPFCGAKQ